MGLVRPMQVLRVDFGARRRLADPTISDTANDGTAMDTQVFATTMGHAVWLMSMSQAYRDLPVREIEARIAVPVFLQQFETCFNGQQPVAFLTWARVSEVNRLRLKAGGKLLTPGDWRSGDNLVVVDCIAPFDRDEKYVQPFLSRS